MLGASLFSDLLGNTYHGAIYLSQTLNFLAPIYYDEEVSIFFLFLKNLNFMKVEATVEVKEGNEKGHFLLKTEIVKLEKQKIAVSGEAKILHRGK